MFGLFLFLLAHYTHLEALSKEVNRGGVFS